MIITACVIVTGVLVIAVPWFHRLDEDDINRILTTALTEPRNAPRWACIDLPAGEAIPGHIETRLLVMDDKGTFDKDVAALIKSGLITVRPDSGQGPTAREKMHAVAVGRDVTALKKVSLSFVDLTLQGKKFHRYDDIGLTLPKGIAGTNRFCAHIQYGGVEKFMPPAKNPFDKNPHQVSWVNFRWKLDESAASWVADSSLVERISSLSNVFREKDGWMHEGIMLERGDDGGWALAENPYTIRW